MEHCRFFQLVEGGGYFDIGVVRFFSEPYEVVKGKPFRCSKRGIPYFAIDCGDYYDIVPLGVLSDHTNIIWVAGNSIPDEAKQRHLDENKKILLLRYFLLKYPKVKPQDMSENQLKIKILEEAWVKLGAGLIEIGFEYPCPEADDLFSDMLDDLDFGMQEMEEGNYNMEQEQESSTNSKYTWSMDQLNSSLHNCASAWAMEHLYSSLDDCVAGDCLHCRSRYG